MATDISIIEVVVESPISIVEVVEPERVTVVEIVDRGLQGPKGPPGEPLYQIHVSATPPVDPQPMDIWIDIS